MQLYRKSLENTCRTDWGEQLPAEPEIEKLFSDRGWTFRRKRKNGIATKHWEVKTCQKNN